MTAEWWIWFKRRHAKEATSANEVTNLYQANELNQYTNINAGAVESVYDADGNMTSYGSLQFTWDAENRLISVSSNGVPVVQNQYDYMSRRIMKATATQTNTFLYDGWNLIHEEMEAATPASRSYVWGLDLSETLQGAGGVGGLLAMLSPDSCLLTPAYDANGNITDLVDTNGATVAHYEYDPYGNTIAKSGDQADANPFRFSSKYWDGETGFYYYGYRYFSSQMGRWINVDPIGERGGPNRYAYIRNNPPNKMDYLGMMAGSRPCCNGEPYDPSQQGCCNGELYDLETQCCEDNAVVDKVSYWFCIRPVGGWMGIILDHCYICCDEANGSECYGHQDNDIKEGDDIPREPEETQTGTCNEHKVCPSLWKKKCDHPKSPRDGDTLTWNCCHWAGWDGN